MAQGYQESPYYTTWQGKGLEMPQPPPDVRDWLQTVGLNKEEDYLIHPDVGKVSMGLGWDRGVDVDGSAALFDGNLQCVDLVWWHKLKSSCGSVKHSGDDQTGEGEGYDEVITVDLSDIPLQVHHILFSVSIYNEGMSFYQVRRAYVNMMHGKPKFRGHVMCSFSLTEMSGSAMLLGLMTRKGAHWNFKALGTPATGRTIQQLVQNPVNLACLSLVPSFPAQLRKVSVTVTEGQSLIARDIAFFSGKSTSDPFYIMKFRKRKYNSRVQSKTLNPKWNEHPVDLGYLTEGESNALKITLYDHDVMSDPDFMGALWIPGRALFNCQVGTSALWFDLGPSKKDKIEGSPNFGRILLSITVQETA